MQYRLTKDDADDDFDLIRFPSSASGGECLASQWEVNEQNELKSYKTLQVKIYIYIPITFILFSVFADSFILLYDDDDD